MWGIMFLKGTEAFCVHLNVAANIHTQINTHAHTLAEKARLTSAPDRSYLQLLNVFQVATELRIIYDSGL